MPFEHGTLFLFWHSSSPFFFPLASRAHASAGYELFDDREHYTPSATTVKWCHRIEAGTVIAANNPKYRTLPVLNHMTTSVK
jgi:hypothetical protein